MVEDGITWVLKLGVVMEKQKSDQIRSVASNNDYQKFQKRKKKMRHKSFPFCFSHNMIILL